MNEQQRLYLFQARSDWDIYRFLDQAGKPICHRLHYLQMCTEKLGKAYLLSDVERGRLHHSAFVSFLRAIGRHRLTSEGMNFWSTKAFQSHIEGLLGLAESIESLAPSLAGDGPNPEYPWPRDRPLHAPVEHRFDVWREMKLEKGRRLKDLIAGILTHFEAWY